MKTGAKILIGVGILAVATTVFLIIRKRSKDKKQAEQDAQSEQSTQQYSQNTDIYTKPETKPQTGSGGTLGSSFGNVGNANSLLLNSSSQSGASIGSGTSNVSSFKAGDQVDIKTGEEYIYFKPIGSSVNRKGTVRKDSGLMFVKNLSGGFTEINVKKYYDLGLFNIPNFSESRLGDTAYIPTDRIVKA